MNLTNGYSVAARSGVLLAVALTASGCLGPTYGTDKSSTEQLFDDITNIANVRPPKGAEIAYSPRPTIVKPPETASLPAPQQSVSKNNPAWVEAPEATRERLVAEAAANENAPGYQSPLAVRSTGAGVPNWGTGGRADGPPTSVDVIRAQNQNQQFQANLKVQQGAYSDRRRFLSDPPLTYRQPADTAPVGELGESEREKEKRRIANATKPGSSKGWFKLPKMPWR